MAIIDLVVILVATASSVLMAWFGLGAASLIVPPIATLAVRGVAYWYRTAGQIPLRPDSAEAVPLAKRFCAASAGQYLNNVLQIIEMLVLGWFASEAGAGFFGFAFQLAIQANAVVAVQFGVVLQPIFGLLKGEPERQAAAFLRAARLLAAIAIPISALQAALALPAFGLLFGSRWDGAVAIFAALSVGQGFVFVAAPATALIKAQGRFRAYVAWQAAHLAAAVGGLVLAAIYGSGTALSISAIAGLDAPPEAGSALAVAISSSLIWGVSSPIGVWLCGRPARVGWRAAIALFVRPWLAATLGSAGAVIGWRALSSLLDPAIAAAVALFVIAPFVLAGTVWFAAGAAPETRSDLAGIVARVTRRIRPGR